jgi:uncharacterized cupin superfamily protein
MSSASAIKFGSSDVSLNPSPIYSDWVLDGEPLARKRIVSVSDDGTACTIFWDCTAGHFKWIYDIDETVYVIEGAAIINEHGGAEQRVQAGDTVFFPAGSRADWTVEKYVRKIAFCRSPLPWQVTFAKRVVKTARRLLGKGNHGQESGGPGMFGNAQSSTH